MLGGLHHVTAIAGDPQHNLDFYTGVLGLRLVRCSACFRRSYQTVFVIVRERSAA